MKKIVAFFSLLMLIGCESSGGIDAQRKVEIKVTFSHFWDDIPVTSADFNNFKFTNKNGELISIERLRYVISKITIGGESKDYQLINVGQNTGATLTVITNANTELPLNFRFGFADIDNTGGTYLDLNSVSFNVPKMLGGGYHYMQFDGKYKDSNNQDAPFNYHTIRAVDNSDPNNLVFEDTSFLVDLGTLNISRNATIEVKVNLAEWFKNPTTWDLNVLNTPLMPNFSAQQIMNQNGRTVFSLGKITQ